MTIHSEDSRAEVLVGGDEGGAIQKYSAAKLSDRRGWLRRGWLSKHFRFKKVFPASFVLC